MADKKLLAWIQDSRKKGWSEEELRKILKNRGYQNSEISEALTQATNAPDLKIENQSPEKPPELHTYSGDEEEKPPKLSIEDPIDHIPLTPKPEEKITETPKKKEPEHEEIKSKNHRKILVAILILIMTFILVGIAALVILLSINPQTVSAEKETCPEFMARIQANFPCEYFIMERDLPNNYSIKIDRGKLQIGTNAIHDVTFGPTDRLTRWDIVIYSNRTAQISINVLTFDPSANLTENIETIEEVKTRSAEEQAPLAYYREPGNQFRYIIINPLIGVSQDDMDFFKAKMASKNLTEISN